MALTRRQFVKSAAAVGIPLFLPKTVFAASERVNVAFIGCGRRSHQLRIPLNATVVAVCDVIRQRLEQFSQEHGAKAYTDYRHILDRRDVDAVIVAPPDHWHALPTILACQAGKDVFVEKPLGLTVTEGSKMVEAARKYNRVVQAGTQARSLHNNRLASEIVRTGLMGKPLRAICYPFDSAMDVIEPSEPVPEGVDWDMYLGQAKWRPYNQRYLDWGAKHAGCANKETIRAPCGIPTSRLERTFAPGRNWQRVRG